MNALLGRQLLFDGASGFARLAGKFFLNELIEGCL